MKSVLLPIKSVKVNPNNPRILKDEKFNKLKQSIIDAPWMLEARPIVIDEDNIVLGGNMRYQALKDLGYKEIHCVQLANLTPEQKQEFIIKDNVSFGEWDWEVLANEWDVEKLEEWGLELPVDTVEHLQAEEDDFEVAPERTKTNIVLGDLIEIGRHRLLCGDSTDSDQVANLMNGCKLSLYITDPPYGVAYVGKTKDALTIQNDALTEEQTHQLFSDAFNNASIFAENGASIYVTIPAGLLQLGFMKVMHDAEALRQCMVWDKGQMVLGHSDYHYQHEPILYGWFPTGKHYFTSDRTKTTVILVKKPVRNDFHPTMKPVELWAELISNSSKTGAICYDSFLGSGTTMIACEQLNRKCYGMELDPVYCQVIVDRMLALDPSLEVKINGEAYEPAAK